MNAILEQVAEQTAANEAERAERWQKLVVSIADETIEADAARREMELLGRTPGELRQAVGEYSRRVNWREQFDAGEVAGQEVQRLTAAMAVVDQQRLEAIQEFDRQLAALQTQIADQQQALTQARAAREELIRSAKGNPEIKRLLSDHSEAERLRGRKFDGIGQEIKDHERALNSAEFAMERGEPRANWSIERHKNEIAAMKSQQRELSAEAENSRAEYQRIERLALDPKFF